MVIFLGAILALVIYLSVTHSAEINDGKDWDAQPRHGAPDATLPLIADTRTPGHYEQLKRHRKTWLSPVLAATVLCVETALVLTDSTRAPDHQVLQALRADRGSSLANLAAAVTGFGDTIPLLTVLVVLGAALAQVSGRKGWRLLVVPSLAALLGWGSSEVLKTVIGRARPPAQLWAGSAHGFAFPSGHPTTSTSAYVVLAVLAADRLPRCRWRATALVLGVTAPLLIGLSRLVDRDR